MEAQITPRKLPTQARSRQKVEAILAAARKVLIEEGHEAITAKRIATEAKVPIASFYQYFPNKESVIHHLFQEWMEELNKRYDSYEDLEEKGLDWPTVFLKLRQSKEDNPQQRKLELELQRAMSTTPELSEVQKAAHLAIAKRMAKIFRFYGSAWSDKELINLGGVLIDLNQEIFDRMERQSEDPEAAKHTQRIAMYGLYCMIERCLRGDDKSDWE